MHFFQLVGAWMFPYTVATAATTEGVSTVEDDIPSSPTFSPGGVNVDSDPGSPSSRSSTSSSLLGARSSSSNSARSPVSKGGATAAPKGHVVRRCLRRFARKLPRAGAESPADERPGGRRTGRKKSRSTKPDRRGVAAAVDGTASEREEAVGCAIAYCKETSRHRQLCTRQFAPSLSLDAWLLDRPEEEIVTETAAAHCVCEGTASAAVPHHGYPACDAECGAGSPSAEEDASCRGPAGEHGTGDVLDGLDEDVLRITSYFASKYVQCTIEE